MYHLGPTVPAIQRQKTNLLSACQKLRAISVLVTPKRSPLHRRSTEVDKRNTFSAYQFVIPKKTVSKNFKIYFPSALYNNLPTVFGSITRTKLSTYFAYSSCCSAQLLKKIKVRLPNKSCRSGKNDAPSSKIYSIHQNSFSCSILKSL